MEKLERKVPDLFTEEKGMNDKIYPRTSDNQTVYLKNVVTNANIEIGDYTMYNDFVQDPLNFEKNNVLYHYPINKDKLTIENSVLLHVDPLERIEEMTVLMGGDGTMK